MSGKKFFIGLLALAAAGAIGYGLYKAAKPATPPFQGQADARTIDVAAKVTGRIGKLHVKEGDVVSADTLLLEIEIPELTQKVAQVKAQEKAAQAKSRLVNEGAREEQIRSAKAQFERARAMYALAEKTYSRLAALYKDGLISIQKFDEARASRDNAKNAMKAAQGQYDMAQNGARADEKVAAEALAEQATKGFEEIETLASEAQVKAPRAGEVSKITLNEGELAPAGFPLVTLIDHTDKWVIFNIREDDLPGISVGTVLKAKIPGISRDKTYNLRVYFINPRADYATFRATRQTTGYDVRTFEVRARPETALDALRPGMSVIVER